MMDRPASVEQIQLVAVLRVLALPQDKVAEALGIGKKRVGEIEDWLIESPEHIQSVLDDEALKRLVARELFLNTTLEEPERVKAGLVTRDDILRHYRQDYGMVVPARLRLGPSRVELHGDTTMIMARYATVEVAAISAVEAKECWATGEVLGSGPPVPLHWEGTPWEAIDPTVLQATISPGLPTRLYVAVAGQPPALAVGRMLPNASFNADVAAFMRRRGFYHFGCGCCFLAVSASPGPDSPPPISRQPGEYRIIIKVGCKGGEGDNRQYTLKAPASWDGLDLRTV